MELHSNLIDGEWVGGEAVPNLNPSNIAEVVGEYARATAADAERAIAAAKAAFPAWSRSGAAGSATGCCARPPPRSSPARRSSGACCRARRARRWPKASARRSAPAQIFEFFAGESPAPRPARSCPRCAPASASRSPASRSASVGLITPWNFPIAIPAWKIAPALAYGNTVVLKPADLVPGCAWALVDILHRAGPAEGRAQPGDGPRLGGRPGDPRQPATSAPSASPARSGTGAAGRRGLRQGDAQVPARDGRQEPAGRARRRRPRGRGRGLPSTAPSSRPASAARPRSRLIVTDGIHDRFVAAAGRADEGAEGRRRARSRRPRSGRSSTQSQLDQDVDYIAHRQGRGRRAASAASA